MGLFDRAKRFFGLGGEEEDGAAPQEGDGAASQEGDGAPSQEGGARAGRDRARDPRHAVRDARGARRRGERPPLADASPGDSRTVEDALAAREAGDRAEARGILREIDRGGGLRTVLRAAAALEAGDEAELGDLLALVAAEEPRWRLPLQVAAALGEPAAAAPWLARAEQEAAPAWAIAWARALSADEAARREGLVALLFADPALARTVAARDLAVEGAEADAAAAQRYASFAHGRDSIRRFGAEAVARVLDRAARVAPAPRPRPRRA